MTGPEALVIPDATVLGVPTRPYEWVRSEWAVLIDCPVNDVAGPHLLDTQDEASARKRLLFWQTNRPDANARLVRRKVVETFGEWEAA